MPPGCRGFGKVFIHSRCSRTPTREGAGTRIYWKDVYLAFCFRRIKLRNFNNQIRKQGSGGRSRGMRQRPACPRGTRVHHSISAWASSLLILNLRAMRRPNTRDKREYESRAFLLCARTLIQTPIRKNRPVRGSRAQNILLYEKIDVELAGDGDVRHDGRSDPGWLQR